MTRAIKAVLLSALVFPGAGQIYLKRYRRGLIMIALALLASVMMLVKAVAAALETVSALPQTGRAIDPQAVADLVAASTGDLLAGSRALLVLLAVCWVISVGDAYRLGKRGEGVL